MRFLITALALSPFMAVPIHAQTANPELVYPLIQKHGGVVPLGDAAQPPRANSKLVLDITAGEVHKTGVLEPLEKAARIANIYAQAGVGPGQGMQLTLILHGKATKAALSDEAFHKHEGQAKNPNLPLLEQLRKAGVEVYVCGQALAYNHYAIDEVAPAITVANSAVSVNVNKQLEGYAYLPFH